MLRSFVGLVAAVAVVLSSRSVQASAISFSFGSTLGPTETAGAPGVNVANWNAITSNGQTMALNAFAAKIKGSVYLWGFKEEGGVLWRFKAEGGVDFTWPEASAQ